MLHDAAPRSAHSLSGSYPFPMDWQSPSDPYPFFTFEHAWQNPLHGESQQTPSTQFPLWHIPPLVQEAPFNCASKQLPALAQ